MVLLGFLAMSWPHRMDVEGWVVGSGGIVGKEGVVLMALPMVISQRGMDIKGQGRGCCHGWLIVNCYPVWWQRGRVYSAHV